MAGLPAFTSTCRNCGAALHGVFCADCGQGHRHERLSVRDWIGDLTDDVLNLRVLRTVIDLTLRPGKMVGAYVDGRRVTYVSPARYAIATCALWWLAVALNPQAAGAGWLRYAQWVNLLALPLLTPVIQLSFWGSRRTFAEYLAFMGFTAGQVFLWRSLLGLAGAFLPFVARAGLAVALLDSALYLVYTGWALVGFERGRVRFLALRVAGALLGLVVLGGVVDTLFRQFVAKL